MTSLPAAFISRNLPCAALVGEGLMRPRRSAMNAITRTPPWAGENAGGSYWRKTYPARREGEWPGLFLLRSGPTFIGPARRAGGRLGADEARPLGMALIVGGQMPGLCERGGALGRDLQAMQERHQVDVGQGERIAHQVAGP